MWARSVTKETQRISPNALFDGTSNLADIPGIGFELKDAIWCELQNLT